MLHRRVTYWEEGGVERGLQTYTVADLEALVAELEYRGIVNYLSVPF